MHPQPEPIPTLTQMLASRRHPDLDLTKECFLYDKKAIENLHVVVKDKNATFHSPGQFHAYRELMSKQRHCLYIVPCGSRKTLPFILAVKAHGILKQSIMVLPL